MESPARQPTDATPRRSSAEGDRVRPRRRTSSPDPLQLAARFADRAPVPVALVTGPEYRVEYVNRACADLMGIPAEKLVGWQLHHLLGEPSYARIAPALRHVVETGSPESDIEIRRQEYHWQLDVWPISAASDSECVLAIQIHELDTPGAARGASLTSEIREINERLLKSALREHDLAERAEAADRAKANFLAVMSHELRTPLNAIIGYADLLQDWLNGEGVETQREQVARINLAAWSLLKIIDQILAFARTGAGHETVQTEVFDVGEAAREALMLLEPAARSKGLRLRYTLPRHPLLIETDKAKLRQILVNLVTNAVKFTPEGEVRLEVRREDEDVVIDVEDTGIGIAPDDLDRIFQPFVQVEQSSVRQEGGAGLGLGLSQRIASLLGGGITVQSQIGVGSTFTLRLPLRGPVAGSG